MAGEIQLDYGESGKNLYALDADGNEVKRRTIQHYRDGRQPTASSA